MYLTVYRLILLVHAAGGVAQQQVQTASRTSVAATPAVSRSVCDHMFRPRSIITHACLRPVEQQPAQPQQLARTEADKLCTGSVTLWRWWTSPTRGRTLPVGQLRQQYMYMERGTQTKNKKHATKKELPQQGSHKHKQTINLCLSMSAGGGPPLPGSALCQRGSSQRSSGSQGSFSQGRSKRAPGGGAVRGVQRPPRGLQGHSLRAQLLQVRVLSLVAVQSQQQRRSCSLYGTPVLLLHFIKCTCSSGPQGCRATVCGLSLCKRDLKALVRPITMMGTACTCVQGTVSLQSDGEPAFTWCCMNGGGVARPLTGGAAPHSTSFQTSLDRHTCGLLELRRFCTLPSC